MVIERSKIPSFLKVFSVGIETAYLGDKIIYSDSYIVIIYYYYPSYKKAYIVKKEGTFKLPFIEDKVTVISTAEQKYCSRLKKVIEIVQKRNGNDFLKYSEIFYQKLMIMIKKNKWNKELIVQFCLNYQRYEDKI